jgi:hypothetical protein
MPRVIAPPLLWERGSGGEATKHIEKRQVDEVPETAFINLLFLIPV